MSFSCGPASPGHERLTGVPPLQATADSNAKSRILPIHAEPRFAPDPTPEEAKSVVDAWTLPGDEPVALPELQAIFAGQSATLTDLQTMSGLGGPDPGGDPDWRPTPKTGNTPGTTATAF